MTFRPLNDRVVVKRDEADSVSPGGIIIPEQAKEKPVNGTVISVGSGEKFPYADTPKVPLSVVPGDRVIFSRLACLEVMHDEPGDFLLIRECDILCVVEK